MATDSSNSSTAPPPASFIRSAHHRSSLRSFPPSASATPSQVEHARQRALAAAEYYHRTVIRNDDGSKEGDKGEAGSQTKHNERNSNGEGERTSTSDAYYKQKLRAGFIDLRNSYHEKRPRAMTSSGYSRGGGRALPKVKENTTPPRPTYRHHHVTTAERRGLYRSNSSLELENLEYADSVATSVPTQQYHHQQPQSQSQTVGGLRTYGSANSLERLSTSGESFFAMLQDYRNENVDQRAPPPPLVHEVLRGDNKLASPSGGPSAATTTPTSSQSKVVNGTTLTPVTTDDDVHTGTSPRLKSKSMKHKERKKERAKSVVSEASSGILKKLRGTKSDPNEVLRGSTESNVATDMTFPEPLTPEENLRRKAFVHYDCHSVGVDLTAVAQRRRTTSNSGGPNTRKNITTGASAASGVKNAAVSPEEHEQDEEDLGDGKTNDLLLSCPYFRNELGGEEERTLCLNRSTAQRRVQQLLGNRPHDQATLLRRPMCNGLSVLDSSTSPHGISQPPILTHRGLVLEYVDQGAFYYRHFFQGTGT